MDWIDLKIDQDRMANGKAVAKRLRAGIKEGGIPWLVILDAEGKRLITSDALDGNIGCPATPEEINHFMHMLRQTSQRSTDAALAALERELREYGAKLTGR